MTQELMKFLLTYDIGNDKYYPKMYYGDIFHYTSPEGMKSIIREKGINIVFWASRMDCLNDKSEGKTAVNVYQQVCKELLEADEISEGIYCQIKDLQPSELMLCLDEEKKECIKQNYSQFVVSFSKDSDSLAMWNYYCKNGKYEGFNIGVSNYQYAELVNRENLSNKTRFEIVQVIYDRQKQKSMISNFVKDILEKCESQDLPNACIWIESMLRKWSNIFKEKYFEHEKEVRVVIDVPYEIKNRRREYAQKIEYRYANGFLIPYIELNISKKDLLCIKFGPMNCEDEKKQEQVKVLEDFLVSRRCWRVGADYSHINIRY